MLNGGEMVSVEGIEGCLLNGKSVVDVSQHDFKVAEGRRGILIVMGSCSQRESSLIAPGASPDETRVRFCDGEKGCIDSSCSNNKNFRRTSQDDNYLIFDI